jgi:hypothetical protein
MCHIKELRSGWLEKIRVFVYIIDQHRFGKSTILLEDNIIDIRDRITRSSKHLFVYFNGK